MNKLYYGDNLEILRRNIDKESFDLCYIDPPFNSKRNYNQIYNNIGKEDKAQAQAFIDTWEWDDYANDGFNQILGNSNNVFTKQSIELILGLSKVLGKGSLLAYLVHMTLRIAEIYRVLKPNGSFYLHCDQTASHYLKIIVDAIFCTRNGDFKNEIIWQRTRSAKQQSTSFGKITDIILFYSKGEASIYNKQYTPLRPEYIQSHYQNVEQNSGRRYMLDNFSQAGQGESRKFGDILIKPPNGKHWIWTQDKIDEGILNGKIVFTENGTPRVKRYLDESKGEYMSNIWTDIPEINSQAKERLGYPTQKPEALLERIIKASSNEGDTILDAYCGCGTSVSVAEKLKRNWVGIDITYQSISLILKRIEETFGKLAIANIELNGIPKDMDSAKALANKKDDRTRKEFEKWAVLTYSNNKALINEKKGADHGIDGIAYIMEGTDLFREVLFSVKSGHSSLSHFRDFCHVITRDKAAIGLYLTLDEPTKPMKSEATKMGKYINPLTEQEFDKISIITIQQILNGEKLNIPTSVDVLKKAEIKRNKNQSKFDF